MKTCSTCAHRHPDERPEYEGAGLCRRFPPQIAVWSYPDFSGPQYEQHWPWMSATDWCGEHRERVETRP